MPLYLYKCQECQALLEILHDIDETSPKRCGFRCQLSRNSNNENRGFGELERQIGSFATLSKRAKDCVTPTEAASVGLSTYENQGDGTFKKIAGKEGPNTLKK